MVMSNDQFERREGIMCVSCVRFLLEVLRGSIFIHVFCSVSMSLT